MDDKRGMVNPVDLIAGTIIIVGGIATILGYVNLGMVFVAAGSFIEAIKILMQGGSNDRSD